MGEAVNNPRADVAGDGVEMYQASTAMAPTPERVEGQSVAYRGILHHLAKFRDGARAVLDLFQSQAPAARKDEAAPPRPAAPAAAIPITVEDKAKTALQLRIDRHMATVDEALRLIATLNPEQKPKSDFPPKVRDQIRTKERTIIEIVAAELHFWAAAIKQNPLAKFDQTEQAWILWIILLANIVGVDAEHKAYLAFLEDWAAQERP